MVPTRDWAGTERGWRFACLGLRAFAHSFPLQAQPLAVVEEMGEGDSSDSGAGRGVGGGAPLGPRPLLPTACH